MVDFAIEAKQKEGKSPLDVICAACLRRDRQSILDLRFEILD